MSLHTLRNEQKTRWIRSDVTSIWIDPEDANLWMVEAFVRAPGGLSFLEHIYTGKAPSVAQILHDTLARGQFSSRPHRLGRPVDLSMSHCALALFHDYCDAWSLDAKRLLDEAYPQGPSFRALDFGLIVEQALWEGIECPRLWGTVEFQWLLELLRGTYQEGLANYLRKYPKGTARRRFS